jgi:hypothetical protein
MAARVWFSQLRMPEVYWAMTMWFRVAVQVSGGTKGICAR